MVIDELYWFLLLFWLIFLLIGMKCKRFIFQATSGMIGIMYGLLLIQGISLWIGLITLCVGIVIMYETMLPQKGVSND